MDTFFIFAGVVLLLLMLPLLQRVVVGPMVVDRIIAANCIGTKTTVLLIIIGEIYGKVDMFVDLAITYALLNFIASLAAARFVERRILLMSQQNEDISEETL